MGWCFSFKFSISALCADSVLLYSSSAFALNFYERLKKLNNKLAKAICVQSHCCRFTAHGHVSNTRRWSLIGSIFRWFSHSPLLLRQQQREDREDSSVCVCVCEFVFLFFTIYAKNIYIFEERVLSFTCDVCCGWSQWLMDRWLCLRCLEVTLWIRAKQKKNNKNKYISIHTYQGVHQEWRLVRSFLVHWEWQALRKHLLYYDWWAQRPQLI